MTRSDVLDYLDSPRFHRHATRALVALLVVMVGAAVLERCDLDDTRTNAPIEEVGE